jgi:hypothetical protein
VASASVQNLGPSISEATAGTNTVVGFGAEAGFDPAFGCPLLTTSEVRCPIPAIAPGDPIYPAWGPLKVFDPLTFQRRLPFDVGFIARVDCNESRELSCDNNKSENTLSFAANPSSDWKKTAADALSGIADPPSASGTKKAPGGAAITQVEVAALKLDGKLKAFSGAFPTPDEAAPRAAKAAKCLWLKNRKAKFAKTDPNGTVCDDPVWLQAKGTSKWSYKLSKPLPGGNYVAYARATTSDGGVEFYFANSEKNRVEFKLED